MKRFLSLILAVTVLASMLSVGASVFAEKTKAPKHKSFSFCKSSDGNRDSFGRHFVRGKVPSDGNRFAWGKKKVNHPNKFNVSSDGAWRKEFKAGSDGNKFPQRKARGNKFPPKKQAPGKNMFFPWDKNNMNIFEKGKNFKPYKK